jgi:sulfur transfer complex TusBCD TusB component (DsrH family)
MKKIAYIISNNGGGELIQESILGAIADGSHAGKIVALYFTEEGVYHLVKGSRRAKEIGISIDSQDVKVIASKQSVKDRKIQNMVIQGVELGTYEQFIEIALDADHIISI